MTCYTVISKSTSPSTVREVRAYTEIRDSFQHDIPVLTFLEQMSKQSEHSAHVKKFKIMFKRFADQGHAGLTSEMFHQAGTVGKLTVMRFSSGSLRVYCFYDGPHIVLAHAALKKSQKTSDSDLNSAAAVEKKYNQGV